MRHLLPPVLFLLLLVALAVVYAVHPPAVRPFELRTPPWDVPLLLGLLVLIWARVQFRRSDAEIMTFDTPRNFQRDGAFRWSRNPMYLGFTLILLGAAMFVNTWCALTAPLIFFLACQFWYIPAEERNMRATFGPDYDDYAWKVRRWI